MTDGIFLPNKFPAFLQGASRIAAETTVVFGPGWRRDESPTQDAVFSVKDFYKN